MKTNTITTLLAILFASSAMANTSADTKQYVDLGLPSGTLWATCNVGAISPEEAGSHFAWGETASKSNYAWSTYTYGTENALTKYCSDSNYGTTDTKVVLDSIDDAAAVNWQGKWRMPTIEEWQELKDSCTWNWQSNYNETEKAGYLVTSKTNGKQIFLPASGYYDGTEYTRPNAYGNYWSASLNTENPSMAQRPDFASDFVNTGNSYRREGLSVRPVQSAIKYTLTVTAGDGGTVTGGGEYFANRTATLTATANEGYTFKQWSDGNTENPRTIIVTQDSTLSAVFEEVPAAFTPQYVDLGLSSGVLWATCNVGATSPEQAGDYFAWGETAPKENYNWLNEGEYKWGVLNWDDETNNGMTKYTKTDGKTVLDPEDDAATANWGGDWRMPTKAEQEELLNECTWEWTDNYNNTGVAGRIVTGSNGNSIFLPAAGYRDDSSLYGAGSNGHYWSSSLNSYYPYRAYYLYFSSGSFDWFSDGYRCYGRSVRPVQPKKGTPTSVETVEHSNAANVRKVLENGTIYILRGNEKYTVQGVKVK